MQWWYDGGTNELVLRGRAGNQFREHLNMARDSGRLIIETWSPDVDMLLRDVGADHTVLKIGSTNGRIGALQFNNDFQMRYHPNGYLAFWDWSVSKDVLTIRNGNVGINDTSPDNALDVKGTIRAQEIIVDAYWADFVFDDDYDLMPLEEVDAYIEKNGHLPEIPDEKNVSKNGVAVGEIQSRLLQKIEELTLHLIEQNKRIKKLERIASTKTCN